MNLSDEELEKIAKTEVRTSFFGFSSGEAKQRQVAAFELLRERKFQKTKNVHTVQKIFCLKQKYVDIAGKKYKLKKLESFCQIYSFFCKDVGKPNTVFEADNADKLRCGLKQC